MTDLSAKIRLTVELQLGHDNVRLDHRLAEDLHADSFDIMNLAAILEEEHGIVITESTAAAIETVADLVALVRDLTARA